MSSKKTIDHIHDILLEIALNTVRFPEWTFENQGCWFKDDDEGYTHVVEIIQTISIPKPIWLKCSVTHCVSRASWKIYQWTWNSILPGQDWTMDCIKDYPVFDPEITLQRTKIYESNVVYLLHNTDPNHQVFCERHLDYH